MKTLGKGMEMIVRTMMAEKKSQGMNWRTMKMMTTAISDAQLDKSNIMHSKYYKILPFLFNNLSTKYFNHANKGPLKQITWEDVQLNKN